MFVLSDSTSCHEFASQFSLAIFFYAKNSPNYREYRLAGALFISMNRRSAIVSPTSKRGHPTMTPSWLDAPRQQRRRSWVGLCVRASVCVRDVFAIYDNNILPRLIMIIIKIIFQYLIEIAQTDDFPSTGTRLVHNKRLCKFFENM